MKSQEYWIPSTEWQDTSSDGLRLTNSRSLLTLNDITQKNISVQGTISSLQQEFTFKISGNSEADIMRWFGCAIVCRIPDIGIKETMQKLYEYYKFYSDVVTYQFKKQESRKSIGKFTSVSKSPELVISE